MEEVHTGGCVCGAVRYRVTGNPTFVAVCHCTFCQKRSSTAFTMVAAFPEQAVEITQGEVTVYEHHSDESGRWLKMSFCPKCGSTVTHIAEGRPGMRMVAGGTLDDPNWLEINRHIWVKSKLHWVPVPEGLPQFERAAPPQPSTP